MNLTEKHSEIRGARRLAAVAVCAVLGLATCGSSLALGMHVVAGSAAENNTPSKAPKQISVSADVMAADLVNKVIPVYPEEAKKARIQGTVVLSAVVGKDGNVQSLRVLSGPNQLQQSALDAVRQWTYKPYLLNGDPIEVKTTVNVVYSLGK